ncbi:hypothetical protein HK096_007685 [Nowakowskiella sp. JEL0078]|nr:hypothetical protein HK096_007685 [Nowakowskiella sp. JEL0078]
MSDAVVCEVESLMDEDFEFVSLKPTNHDNKQEDDTETNAQFTQTNFKGVPTSIKTDSDSVASKDFEMANQRLASLEQGIFLLEQGMQKLNNQFLEKEPPLEQITNQIEKFSTAEELMTDKINQLSNQVDNLMFYNVSHENIEVREMAAISHVIGKILPQHESRIMMLENNAKSLENQTSAIDTVAMVTEVLKVSRRIEEFHTRASMIEDTLGRLVTTLETLNCRQNKMEADISMYAMIAGFSTSRRIGSCGLDMIKKQK